MKNKSQHFDADLKSPERLSADVMATTLSRALSGGLIGGSDDNTVVFYDLSRLNLTLDALKRAFPSTTLHTIAVKANPSVGVLKRIRLAGHGVEVASMGELHLALAAGFPMETIVFDSPVKTSEELEVALKMGIRINANTIGELTRIDKLYSSLKSSSLVGIRINPEIGKGNIDSTSVAVQHSKFGVSLRECRSILAAAFSEYSWLNGLHLHIGSQGMSLDQLLDGVAAVYDFFLDLKDRARITFFDIGGGISTQYKESDNPIQFDEYAAALRHRCPSLFESDICLITEFGRALHANCGWVASKVEYVIEHGDGSATLIVHVGADMFLRKAYRPEDWHHEISICDKNGQLRTEPQRVYSIAGPLCFAGDYLARSVSLPMNIREGDYVLIHDSGAYTFSMWSIYNSRLFPSILGYEDDGKIFTLLKEGQTIDDIVAFWSMSKTR